MPAQAQKHVTVNEALARLDAVAQLRVVSSERRRRRRPPAADGASYLVPAGATGDWAGPGGEIAVWSNGGWVYLAPKAGWRAWDESRGGHQTVRRHRLDCRRGRGVVRRRGDARGR